VRILNGEKAAETRWGIRESDLPSGSTVLFKPPSVWETYRWPILSYMVAVRRATWAR
jgi:hypothetical protein